MSDMLSPLADLRPDPTPVRGRSRRRVDHPALDLPTLDLRAMVLADVVPRLHAALTPGPGPSAEDPVGLRERRARDEVLALADDMLADDIEGACRRVAVLRAGGQSLESIFLHVLAPTACHLRDLWSEDLCGSADVTLALCNLRTLLRRHADAFGANAPETGRRALVVSSAPTGGTDVGYALFELTMAASFFRREGWQPRIECGLSHPAVRAALRGEWFDLVVILAPDGGSASDEAVAAGVRAVRREAANPALGVIVCGQASDATVARAARLMASLDDRGTADRGAAGRPRRAA